MSGKIHQAIPDVAGTEPRVSTADAVRSVTREMDDYARRHDADQQIILRQQDDIDRLEGERWELLSALKDAVSRLEFDGYRIAGLAAAIAKAERGKACERYRELAGPFPHGRCDKCQLPESLHGSATPVSPAHSDHRAGAQRDPPESTPVPASPLAAGREPRTILDVRSYDPRGRGDWNADIPIEVQRELMGVARDRTMSFDYLCAIYRKGASTTFAPLVEKIEKLPITDLDGDDLVDLNDVLALLYLPTPTSPASARTLKDYRPQHGKCQYDICDGTRFSYDAGEVPGHGVYYCLKCYGAQIPLIPAQLQDEDLDNLTHMLGVSKKHKKGYRNYFVAGGKDVLSMERLRAAGFVVRNEGYTGSSMPCYHATIEGAKRIGLKELPR